MDAPAIKLSNWLFLSLIPTIISRILRHILILNTLAMKKRNITPLILTTVFSQGTEPAAPGNAEKNTAQGIAVLELFTSEGCSSCPPADDLIGKIQNEFQDKQVFALAYHVDYWDHQGWKDIYSHSDYTKRQYAYAQLFRTRSVYTPQLVINGQEEYIGSREISIRGAIDNALAIPAAAELKIKTSLEGNKIVVDHTAHGASKQSNLLLAVVQKSAQTAVKRGENADRVLSHFQIVHHLHSHSITSDSHGVTQLPIPDGFEAKIFEVIGFLQDTDTGVISAADRANF